MAAPSTTRTAASRSTAEPSAVTRPAHSAAPSSAGPGSSPCMAPSSPATRPTTVARSSFSGNSAVDGGAMYVEDSMAVSHCNFTKNTADDAGGGIYVDNGSPTVTVSGFYQNQAEFGG